MRYMPQLRLPVSGFLENTIGSVMKGPPSSGQQCRTGSSRSEKLSLRITSLQSPSFTILGKKAPTSASFGSIFSFPIKPSGMRICRYSEMRAATSSTESTSKASCMRFMLAKALINTGISLPLGFSNSKAGPAPFTERSANSVISRCGSTSKPMRLSSSFFSSARMKSRKLL